MAETERDDGAVGFLRCFGAQLRLLREREGLTRAELGSRLGYGEDQIASVELGRRIPKPEMIDRADEVLGAGGLLVAMKAEVARARYPAFFRDAARLEAEAVELHVYANQAVPGLLQTEGYAREVFTMRRPLLGEETVSQRVAARLARQDIFAKPTMPTISFVIEESVLRRPLGGQSVRRGQWEHILLCGRRRNVVVQVMPIECEEHAALSGPFTLIETRDGRRIAYVEAHKDSRLYTDRSSVRELEEAYGLLRAQALTPRESMDFVETLLGEQRNDHARSRAPLAQEPL
ncbi:MAG TPA: transcriptional regulator [Streptomyces sp.]|uniref:Helix-turn-helix transcriptional regulator n=1 Tax=Streptomyces salyersiae TaxID=3075530 RepID=A0ABU2RF77_9ACTN|nr:helix-turn-helix transcriptional regulator [Streptomyces sp. DSM 41770]MDT0426948.1 helix-turn-helix transcriptional regulator [Streptomyces sp. DSM 41770]HBF82720.1 transcriptional regulator [Streptomyces sp.]